MTELDTGIVITYNKKGNIKKCISMFDNQATNNPLTIKKIKSSYVPLSAIDINSWFSKFTSIHKLR